METVNTKIWNNYLFNIQIFTSVWYSQNWIAHRYMLFHCTTVTQNDFSLGIVILLKMIKNRYFFKNGMALKITSSKIIRRFHFGLSYGWLHNPQRTIWWSRRPDGSNLDLVVRPPSLGGWGWQWPRGGYVIPMLFL